MQRQLVQPATGTAVGGFSQGGGCPSQPPPCEEPGAAGWAMRRDMVVAEPPGQAEAQRGYFPSHFFPVHVPKF